MYWSLWLFIRHSVKLLTREMITWCILQWHLYYYVCAIYSSSGLFCSYAITFITCSFTKDLKHIWKLSHFSFTMTFSGSLFIHLFKEAQDKVHDSGPFHFILTISLCGRFSWEKMIGLGLPRELNRRRDLNLVLHSIDQQSNYCTTLAQRMARDLNSVKISKFISM